jgi:hypothetical protein
MVDCTNMRPDRAIRESSSQKPKLPTASCQRVLSEKLSKFIGKRNMSKRANLLKILIKSLINKKVLTVGNKIIVTPLVSNIL